MNETIKLLIDAVDKIKYAYRAIEISGAYDPPVIVNLIKMADDAVVRLQRHLTPAAPDSESRCCPACGNRLDGLHHEYCRTSLPVGITE